jgi:arsenate reductase
MATGKPTVLFLCADNSTRSQLAEALLRHRAGDRFEVHSAGLEPRPVHPMVADVLREQGLEAEALEAKKIGAFLGRRSVRYAVIVGEPDEPECPRIFPFAAQTTRWPVAKPTDAEESPEGQLSALRRTRDEIDGHLSEWLSQVAAR